MGFDVGVEWSSGFEYGCGAAVAEKIYGSDFALLYSEALEGVDGNVDVDAARCVVEVDGDEQSLVLVASQICELAMWIEVAIVHIHQVEECTFGDGSLVVADEEHFLVGATQVKLES